jgi:hypothetical protein
MKPRRLFGLAVVAALLTLFGTAIAERCDTWYEFGFSRSLNFISTRVDSIPAGATFNTRWIPISGARMVSFFMRATATDSDSAVSVQFASADTVIGAAANIDTSSAAAGEPGSLGLGVGVYSSYRGSGGVGWGANLCRTITVVPFKSATTEFPYIPQRWVRFTVIAPLAGTVAVNSWNSKNLNSMRTVRIWVEVRRDGERTGADPYYPFNGVASP